MKPREEEATPRGFSFRAGEYIGGGVVVKPLSLGESYRGLTGCGGFDSQDDLRLRFYDLIFLFFNFYICVAGDSEIS